MLDIGPLVRTRTVTASDYETAYPFMDMHDYICLT